MNEDEAVNWALTSGDVEPKIVRPRPEGRAFGGTLLDGSMNTVAVNSVPSQAQETTNDQDMALATPGSSDGNMNAEVDPPRQLRTDDSVVILEDETMIVGSTCARCTFINPPGLQNCEICDGSLQS